MKSVIPAKALEQHVAVLGKNGSGKTYATKAVIVEPLLAAGKHVCVVDPTSAWWGLRTSRDGKGPGFQVLVLGGDHGDLPLPPLGGAAVARLVVEQRTNVVIDTGNLTVGERTRWMVDFAGTLYRLNRVPLYLVIDEAHVFAPQGKVPDPDTGKMLHAVNQLASGGRSRGIRLTMITQRPQKLHKDALTTADTLVAMRVLAPHDREAVKAWIDGCGDPAQGKQVLDSLAGLQRGEGWVWYPEGGHLQRVKFPGILTFDSSATPTEGRALPAPKGAAEIDLTEIRRVMADAVKEAEANDPRLLRQRIAVLEKKHIVAATISVSGFGQADLDKAEERGRAEGFLAGVKHVSAGTIAALEQLRAGVGTLGDVLKSSAAALSHPPAASPECMSIDTQPAASPRPVRAPGVPPGAGVIMGKAERRVLTALAQYPAGRTKVQVAVLTGYAVTGGGFNNALGALRSAGRVSGSGDSLTITDAGLAALGPFTPLPTGRDLVDHWMRELGKAERAVIEVLHAAYPGSLSKEELGRKTGYEPSGGGFNNALGRLRTLELITGRGELRASEDLFA